jgi:hypothetical protein
MLTSPVGPADAILDGMDLTSRVLVVLGFAAGAVTGVMAVAALLLVVGMDAHGVVSQLLLAVGGASGAIVGARANIASGRLLLAERTADLA